MPSRLERDVKRAREVAGADALFAASHEVKGKEPLPERQHRVLKDGARRDGELPGTGAASPERNAPARAALVDIGRLALWTGRLAAPAEILKMEDGACLIWVALCQLK